MITSTFALAAALMASAEDRPPPKDRVDDVVLVSLYSLIANPQRYTNDPLKLGGYWLVGDEMSLLCPQPVAASPRDCVTLNLAPEAKAPASRLAGRAVIVEGRFKTSSGDNWTIYSGSVVATEIRAAWEIRSQVLGSEKEK
jgi:hypothetical protein